jgi:hypothetical protein
MITVNGKTYIGNNVTINNGQVIVDGKVQEKGVSGVVKVIVEGKIDSLKTQSSVEMHGSVLGDIDAGGSVKVSGDVKGSIDAGGSVSCGSVGGDVDAGGSVSMRR